MKALFESLRSLGALKLGAMAAVALVSFGLLGFVMMRSGEGPMAPLYADLELREAGQLVDQLDRARIPRQLEAGGTRILVPVDQVSRARLLLAKEGLPSGGSIGYEIFDRGDNLTASGFQQVINQTRAMEGELSRTIRMLQGVKAARVHLVLPKREPFVRDRQEAQASVVLTMAGAARLDGEGTQAVLNLIAAAVPGLRPQNIAIVDSRGNLLARAGQPTGVAGSAQSADDVKHASEQRLARAVEEMLERTLGPGRVRAEAAIDMDFDQGHETQERYDPDSQVVRSQQSTSDNNRTTEVAANVSVQNNLPNADAGANPAGSQEQKQEETTNYEIGKTVRTLVHEQPQLRRISLAVMVDGSAARGADGTVAYVERTPDELARIATLVRSAIGFNEQRGDRVEVVNMRFVSDGDGQEAAAPAGWMHLEKSEMVHIAETVFLAVGALLTLLFVMRPMVLRLTMPPPAAPVAPVALALSNEAVALNAPAADGLVQLSNVVGETRIASIRRVSELVDSHPEESLAMLRSWITPEVT